MTQTDGSRTKVLSLLLATVVAFSAAAGVGGFAGVTSAAGNTNLAVSITDADNTVVPNGSTTVEIAVTNADGGVGAAELGVELSNPGVASITDVTVLNDPGPTDNSIAGGGQSADLKWAFANSTETGSVTIVEVTLQGTAPGSTDVNIVENSQTGNLIVGDENGTGYTLDTIGSATLSVTGANSPPSADAGPDQMIDEGTSVTLDATGSSDPNGDPLSYSWSVTDDAGTGVMLTGANTATPSFTAPEVLEDQTLTFEVEVTDVNGASDNDTVSVAVQDTDAGPVAGDVSVRLDGSDGDGLISATTTNTYDVVVEDVNGGVGAFSLTVSSGNTSVATITDASVEAPSEGGTDLSSVSVSDSSATLEAAVRNTSDTGDVAIASVTTTGQSAGTASIDVSVSVIGNESGAPYTVTSETGASLDVIELPTVDPAFPGVPTDPDDDGEFEDVNGDGELTVVDVQALWANRNSAAITDFGERYDFNNDGEFNVVDVQALWNELDL